MEQELQKEPKRSFYALEQLRQTAEAILRGSQRLLKCRAGVEKYRTAQPQRAYAYYLELQKTRDALLAALGDAQRNLLELEESALAQKAGQLQAGLRRFDLMSRAYKPVYEVLTGFAKALPQTDTVNAAVIGRLMNHVRMGYYPTDPENIAHILRGIAFPEGVLFAGAVHVALGQDAAAAAARRFGSLPTATTATPTAWSWTNTARRKRKPGSTVSASEASFTARSAERHFMCCS